MSNISASLKRINRRSASEESVPSRRRFWRWLLIPVGLALIAVVVMGSLTAVGNSLINRMETETDPQAQESWGPNTYFLETRSGTVHVLDQGEGDVILLTHGSGRSIADWQDGIADRLSESYRVVAYDNYGFGLSDRNYPGEYSNALWEQQAIDVIDALEIDKVVIVGHSAGAIVAVTFAADHPDRVRGVVLTGHSLTSDPSQMFSMLPGVAEYTMAQNLVVGDTFSDSHRAKMEEAYRIRGTHAAFLTFMRSQYSLDSFRLFDGTYEDIQVPVLQMHGTNDEQQDFEAAIELGSRLADTRFVPIEGASHDVHIDAPDQWVDEVSNFAAGLPLD